MGVQRVLGFVTIEVSKHLEFILDLESLLAEIPRLLLHPVKVLVELSVETVVFFPHARHLLVKLVDKIEHLRRGFLRLLSDPLFSIVRLEHRLAHSVNGLVPAGVMLGNEFATVVFDLSADLVELVEYADKLVPEVVWSWGVMRMVVVLLVAITHVSVCSGAHSVNLTVGLRTNRWCVS